jgi:hypothetical protein
MANEIYDKSWWGDGVCNNTVGWGLVYKPYAGCTPAETRFVISVKTDNTGTSNDDQFTLPWTGDYDVDWGDGTTDTGQSGSTTHTYSTAGTYDVSVTPTNNCTFNFNNGGDKQKLIEIKNWGTGTWTSFAKSFLACSKLTTISATDTPDLSIVTTIAQIFQNCNLLSSASSLANWDTSNVTRMENSFRNAEQFNENITSWDISNVTRIDGMFFDCLTFNQPIGSWNIGNVTTISNMFRRNNFSFDQSLAGWDITSVATAADIFKDTGLSTSNYDATLIGWAAQSITIAVSINFGNSQYTLGGTAEAARDILVNTYVWTITDGGGI